MNPFSNKNPLESLMQLGQMGEQLRKTFGDDFLSKLMAGGPQGLPMHPMNPFQAGGEQPYAGGSAGGDWNPFQMGSFWPNLTQFGSSWPMFPKLDMYQFPTLLTVVAEIPGLQDPRDISVVVEPRRLQLSGQITSSYQAVKRDQFSLAERHHGSFDRSIELPVPVKTRQAEARYHNGLLEVTLPKASHDSKAGGKRVVQIQTK